MSGRPKRISDTIPVVTDDGQRRTQRVPLNAAVTFLHPEGVHGQTIDANADGMRVVTDGPLKPGDRCVAIVHLETGDETHERLEVIWSRRGSRGWEAGLKFAG